MYTGAETFSDVNLTLSDIDDFDLLNINLEELAHILHFETQDELKAIIK
jgi:hypothetical protein